ncbi:unnamed protein product [Didymodactylos carnosus]|uniref:Uncharacterized protein n=1 Tax=Didymodactylos carnosus TaxID=1234261 RepID=A0A815UFP5_9BILA|nr:unnamed protein product [Didymodactylos carnosus]CAF1518838.1 unnamed protein product [Didymodactylos carnosus]CAF3765497.1 unnamed protein product [Didymodactylos carnosus]CAF4378567.1 unnamed protein product [Didymodactylos carnosus]
MIHDVRPNHFHEESLLSTDENQESNYNDIPFVWLNSDIEKTDDYNEKHEKWIDKYSKIRGVYIDKHILFSELAKTVQIFEHNLLKMSTLQERM